MQIFGPSYRDFLRSKIQPDLRARERHRRPIGRSFLARDVKQGIDISVCILNREKGETKVWVGLKVAHFCLLLSAHCLRSAKGQGLTLRAVREKHDARRISV